MDRHFLFFAIFLLPTLPTFAQSEETTQPEVNYNIYMDLFYSYGFNKPAGNIRLPYLYHYNRQNQINLNHGYMKFNLDHPRYRANFGLHTGTYVMDNYASEPDLLSAILDANVGFSLNSNNTLWLDIGIFGNSHIGTESTEGWSNWTLSRTILSENVPYFQSGAILSYSVADWYFAFLVLNGWQRIQRVSGNSLPAFGSQITYSGFDNLIFNWSTFLGSEFPDNLRRMRYISSFSTSWHPSENIGFVVGWDSGSEQDFKGSSTFNNWNAWVVVARFDLNNDWASALRYEYYGDPASVIVSAPGGNGYRTSGVSANLDRKIHNNFLFRLEGRYFFSPYNIYNKEGAFISSDFALITSVLFNLNQD